MYKLLAGSLLVLLFSLSSSAQWTEPELLAENLDGWQEPWISNDGARLYVSSMVNIYVTTRVHPWGWWPPTRLPDHINDIGDVRSPCESPTGDTLYFTSWDFVNPAGWDVYFCVSTDTGWGEVQNAGPNVNSPDAEESVGISRDGTMLLVQAGLTIKYHEKQEDESWGPRISFGLGVPGREEEHPSLSPNNSRLFFAGRGANMGDIMESRLVEGIWQPAFPLPNPLINGSTTRERDPCMANDGRTLIFRKETEEGFRLFFSVDTTVSAIENNRNIIPASIRLSVYPNPFNSITTLTLSLPGVSDVEVSMYDITGRYVKDIAQRRMAAGEHSFQINAAGLPSGIYFARAQTDLHSTTQKLILLK
jgi:hypothetical protein